MLSDAKNISPKLPLPVKEFQTKRNKRLKKCRNNTTNAKVLLLCYEGAGGSGIVEMEVINCK